jgi:hypothetical protein
MLLTDFFIGRLETRGRPGQVNNSAPRADEQAPVKTGILKTFWLRTGLANIFAGACVPQLRIICGEIISRVET